MTQGTFQESGIDRSIGILVLGMVVAGFVFLTILGMSGVQKTAERATSAARSDNLAAERTEEVVDFGE